MKNTSKLDTYSGPKLELERTFEDQVKSKPKRYWPGQVLQSKDDDSDDDIFKIEPTQKSKQIKIEETVGFNNKEDDDEEEQRRKIVQARKREIIKTEVVQQGNTVQVDEEELLKKRQAIKRREEREEQELDKEIEKEESEEEEEEEEEDEYAQNKIELLKPVFVSRNERDLLDKKIEEEIRLKEEKQKNLERKKVENKLTVLQVEMTKQRKEESDSEEDGNLPNDQEETEEDYTLWKIRELKRLKRDQSERNKYEIEKAEIERRRRMTDAERIEEDFRLGSQKTRMEEKTKYTYMQKYYHLGAFYQDKDDPIFQRDYNLPVGEDLWDKSKLPSILQVRRGQFGKKGRSKYTHLTDQDTTDFNPEYQVDDSIRHKNLQKQAGNWATNRFK